MPTTKTQNPRQAGTKPRAKFKNVKPILTEIAGCLITAILWVWITGTAIIGMIETRVITNETVLAAAGVATDGR